MASTVEVGKIHWAFTERGSGPPLLFFHGTLSGKEVFEAQIAALSHRYRCIAVDWPGHGGSGYDPDGWSVDDLVDAVPALIDALGERTGTLIGVSQGGAISMRAALRWPDRVNALVTMNAGPDALGPEAIGAIRELGRTLSDGSDDERREVLARYQRTLFHAPGWVDDHPEEAERELRSMLGHDRRAVPLVTKIPEGYDSIEHELHGIRCPTLVVWGEQDPRADWGPRMVELIPDARLEIVPGAGHHVTLDRPEAASAAIAKFVDGLEL